MIHKRCTLEGQSIIDRVVTDKARILRDIIKPSKGIFARMSFWKQQEPIEIDSVWKEVVTLKEPKCLVLIEDMARLKGYNIGP